MFEHSASDKMQLVGVGDLVHPGSCLVCGNGTCFKGYINLGVSLEWEGQAYLCYFCTVQIAEILGCMIPEEVQVLKQSYDDLAAKYSAMENELGEARERLKAFDLLLNRAQSNDALHYAMVDELSGPIPDKTSAEPDSAISGESSDESVITESTEGSGPDDISESERVDITAPGGNGGLATKLDL